MVERSISLKDIKFPVGKARAGRVETIVEPETTKQPDIEIGTLVETGNEESPTPVVSQQNASRATQKSGDWATNIRELRGPRKLTSATQFNVILDEPLKDRLLKAAYEQQVKQTVIVRAAIDAFLKKAGY